MIFSKTEKKMMTQEREGFRIERSRGLWEKKEIEELGGRIEVEILSMILGEEKERIADKIRAEHGMREFSAWQKMKLIGEVLERDVEKLGYDEEGDNPSKHVKFTDQFLTLNQWMEENKNKVAIVRCGNDVVYVAFGHVMHGNARSRIRVTHAIFILG